MYDVRSLRAGAREMLRKSTGCLLSPGSTRRRAGIKTDRFRRPRSSFTQPIRIFTSTFIPGRGRMLSLFLSSA